VVINNENNRAYHDTLRVMTSIYILPCNTLIYTGLPNYQDSMMYVVNSFYCW